LRIVEVGNTSPSRIVWRILLGVLVIFLVFIVAVAMGLPRLQDLIGNPGTLFADDVLQDAVDHLASAESRLISSPGDDAAHIVRARALITLGNLEGARIEWRNYQENGSAEWGEIVRTLDELDLKTEEIRALLHDAETSPSPADNYPPIYTLLDDIVGLYDGMPRYRALFLKGYLLLREGRKAEAYPIFSDQLADYILQDYVRYNRARSLIVSGSEDDALESFDSFLSDFPDSRLAPLAHLERINILRDLDRPEDALAECNRALDSYPTSPFAAKTIRKIAEIYESEMDFVNGASARVRLVREFPESNETSDTIDMFFGGVYAPNLLGESDTLVITYAAVDSHTSDAFELLSQLADKENLSPEERAQVCHGAARCEYSYSRYYECIEWADRTISLAPGSEWADRAGIRKGHAYWRIDKLSLAKDTYWETARGHGPLAALAAEILWQRAYEISDLATVSDACRYIVDEYPDSEHTPHAMTMLAYLGCRDRQYQSALGFAERCVAAFPDDISSAEASFWQAEALEGLGRTNEAADVYQALASANPWNYWGIRAREHIGLSGDSLPALDPLEFEPQLLSSFSGRLATAWELYDAGVLELAESEFLLAVDENLDGARSGLAIVYAETDRLRNGVLSLRDAAAVGDQAFLTPARQARLLDELYPQPFEELVRASALAHDIPPEWLWGAMRQESTFNARARSSSDARGLIQIMPETGRFIAAQRGAATFDPETLWDPSLNLDYGGWYFSYLREQVGSSLLDVLTAYNGGPGRLRQYKADLPTRDQDIFINAIPNFETRNFAHWVYANIRIYDALLEAEGYELVPF